MITSLQTMCIGLLILGALLLLMDYIYRRRNPAVMQG
jgi:hypothetical protein